GVWEAAGLAPSSACDCCPESRPPARAPFYLYASGRYWSGLKPAAPAKGPDPGEATKMSRDWRALLHGWPYPAVVVDQESAVMERNTAADRLFGSSLVIGSPLREAVHYVEAG